MPEAIELRLIDGDREPWVPLLLEADESEPVLREYLDLGDLFELSFQGAPIGVALLLLGQPGEVEIKNIALDEVHRGRGLGRSVIVSVAALARTRGSTFLTVGTADSSLGTIAFYRACGFAEAGRDEGFFDRYPEPVVEDGLRAHDMIRFRMRL